MKWNELEFFPVMGESLTSKNTLLLDFTAANADLETLDLSDTTVFDKYVFDQINREGKRYGIGGYLEKRVIYRRSTVFDGDATPRTVHLGIDIWTEAGAPVYSPYPGRIHGFGDNAGFGDYGPTIILSHETNGEVWYSLYGHLFRKDLESLQVGQLIEAGQCIAHVGPFPENGDWPPHLHFQLMREIGNYRGDYPGVAAESDLPFFQKNCPNPNHILRCSLLGS